MAWTDPVAWVAYQKLQAADLNTYVNDNLDFLKQNVLLEASTELTIASGAVTISQTYHDIDTEGDASSDDLDTISGATEGRILILRANHTDRTVVLKNGTGNLDIGGDIYLDDINKRVILIGDSSGNLHLLYTDRQLVFCVNAFQYPAAGTDWTPTITGAQLGASKTAKKCWLPLNFLKVGDQIVSYYIVGDATEVTALTLDCKLVRINYADPLTTTDISGGAITQITIDGNFRSQAILTSPEVVAIQKQYLLEINGTTGASDQIDVIGAEITIRRLT